MPSELITREEDVMTTTVNERTAVCEAAQGDPIGIAIGDEAVLLRRYGETRSECLREELVRRFMPLARSLAMRYRHGSESAEDLTQVANLGLLRAIDGFDPGRGTPFTAYAVPTILGQLRRHFRDNIWTLRLPRSLGELTLKIREARDGLTEELGSSPTADQIAARLEISTEEVLEGLEAERARGTRSLDAPVGTDENLTPTVETIGRSEPGYDRVEAQLAADRAELDRNERQVLLLYYGGGATQREIGEQLGVSQMQISRISRRALRKLLASVRGEQAEGASSGSELASVASAG